MTARHRNDDSIWSDPRTPEYHNNPVISESCEQPSRSRNSLDGRVSNGSSSETVHGELEPNRGIIAHGDLENQSLRNENFIPTQSVQGSTRTPLDDEEKNTPIPPPELKDPNIVTFPPNDPSNPFNWSKTQKAWITFQLGMLAMAGSLGSSIVSPANEIISEYIGVSSEVGVLAVSLYM